MDVDDRGENYPNRDVIDYSRDQHIWNAPRAASANAPAHTNPWHPSLNNTMFCL